MLTAAHIFDSQCGVKNLHKGLGFADRVEVFNRGPRILIILTMGPVPKP